MQTNLTKASAERAEVDQRLREMVQVAEDTTAPQEMQREASAARPVLKRILEQHQQTEQQIRLRETEIMSVLTSEQARWTDFNSRLDELERSLIASRR